MALPPLLPVSEIWQRLRTIFPEGIENRTYVTREMAAKTIFVMLYTGAVEGAQRWVRPDQITWMSDEQAHIDGQTERETWTLDSLRANAGTNERRWYAANTREPIRDETLRAGFVRFGAVKERKDLPTAREKPLHSWRGWIARHASRFPVEIHHARWLIC